jgi:hypothetical protein
MHRPGMAGIIGSIGATQLFMDSTAARHEAADATNPTTGNRRHGLLRVALSFMSKIGRSRYTRIKSNQFTIKRAVYFRI